MLPPRSPDVDNPIAIHGEDQTDQAIIVLLQHWQLGKLQRRVARANSVQMKWAGRSLSSVPVSVSTWCGLESAFDAGLDPPRTVF